MSFIWSVLIVLGATGIGVAAILLVRRRAPEGGYFADGDRAAGVFGVIATGFSVLLGLIVFLAFSSYDQSRTGAEAEAMAVRLQSETAEFLPTSVRPELGNDLECYARYVIFTDWPRLGANAETDDSVNPWSITMAATLKSANPKTVPEQVAYLDNAFTTGFGGLKPEAMERTLSIIGEEGAAGGHGPLPCDENGVATS